MALKLRGAAAAIKTDRLPFGRRRIATASSAGYAAPIIGVGMERRRELIHNPFPPVRIGCRASTHSTNLLYSPLGTAIVWTDDENDTLDRPECMLQH